MGTLWQTHADPPAHVVHMLLHEQQHACVARDHAIQFVDAHNQFLQDDSRAAAAALPCTVLIRTVTQTCGKDIPQASPQPHLQAAGAAHADGHELGASQLPDLEHSKVLVRL